MTALRAHRKFSPGDDPWMPVELIEVTSPPKAHEGRGLQHERKVIKIENVMEGRADYAGGKVNKTRSQAQRDTLRDENSQIFIVCNPR